MMDFLARSASCPSVTCSHPVGVTLGKKLSSRKTGEFLCLSGETGFRFYGAAVSLSRRRSLRRGTPGHDGFPRALGIMPRHFLRRGTPGHDGFPRALGIMPRHFLRRGIRTHNEIPRALGIMRPHHRTHPVGVTLGKSLDSSESRLFCLYLSLFKKE